MFAKVIKQDEEIKKLFYKKIQEKVDQERQSIKDRIDDKEYPKVLSWLVKGFAVHDYNVRQSLDTSKGNVGEDELRRQMWMLLPRDSIILPDFVFEPKKDEFIQIDHTIINLKGIFLIEVKTWSGSFLASDKVWKMRQGKKWIPVENPSKQHKRHFELFNLWLQNNIPELYPNIKDCIYPVIVLKKVDWIQAKYSTIPVVSGASGLVDFMIGRERGKLTPEIVETIVEKLYTSKPYEEKAKAENIKYKEGKTKYGKKYVRIYGSKEEADKIAENYRSNYKITDVRQDKLNSNVFFFYIEDT
jgi:hypothetical protein